MTQDPDRQAVRRVLAGEVEAFREIVERWRKPLIELAYRSCGHRAVAEELAQEAFVKIYKGLAGWRGEGRFSTWMFAIALRHVRSAMRRQRPRLESLDQLERAEAEASSQHADLVQRQTNLAVRRAVRDLPAKYREAIVLYYFADMDVDQAARHCAISPGSMKVRLHRAREKLRRALEDSSSGVGAAVEGTS